MSGGSNNTAATWFLAEAGFWGVVALACGHPALIVLVVLVGAFALAAWGVYKLVQWVAGLVDHPRRARPPVPPPKPRPLTKPDPRVRLAPVEVHAEGATCLICGRKMGDDVVYCGSCRTPYHRECFRYVDSCALFGCGCRRYLRSAS